MKYMGLDVGDKTIGVALSDALLITAQGIKTIMRTNIKKDTDEIINLIDENEVKKIIIGLPKNLNGTDSIQTEKVYSFKEKLENKLRSTGRSETELIFWDERYSTVIAQNILIEADVTRKKRKEVIDKMAAVVILQSYLDFSKNKPDSSIWILGEEPYGKQKKSTKWKAEGKRS